MTLAHLQRDDILSAIAEYDLLGRNAFLATYGFGRARVYFIRHDGRLYDAKAIVGGACRKRLPAVSRSDLEKALGKESGVAARLRALDFHVESSSIKDRIARRYIPWSVFIGALLLLFMASLLLQRIRTWEFLLPWYKTSSPIGLPSVVLSFLAILFAFVDQSALQTRFRNWLNERIEESRLPYFLLATGGVGFVCAVLASYLCTPSEWKRFIDNEFLPAASGHYSEAIEAAGEIRGLNADTLTLFRRSLGVFEIRARTNLQHQPLSEQEKRDLEAVRWSTSVKNEQLEALRVYAVAEATCLLAPLLHHTPEAYQAARKGYDGFQQRPGRAVTVRWRDAAKKNSINTYCYEGIAEKIPPEAWQGLAPDWTLYANLVARHVYNNQFDTAIAKAVDGLQQMEAHPHHEFYHMNNRDILIENKMSAEILKGCYEDALATYDSEYSDQLRLGTGSLETTWCLALILAGKTKEFDAGIRNAKLMSADDRELILGVSMLRAGNRNGALAHFRNLSMCTADPPLEDKALLQKVHDKLKQERWLMIPDIQALVEALEKPVP